LLVARFNRGGGLDKSFSGGGIFLGPAGTAGRAVAIQSDGKIVVAGARLGPGGGGDRGMLVMRLRRSGHRDRSFSGNGTVTLLAGRSGDARAVAIHRGKVVVAGSATLGSSGDAFSRTAVARLRRNGHLDRSFGGHGVRVLDFGRLSVANAVAVLGSGKIVLAGSQRGNLQTASVLAARLTKSGRRDRSFSRDGLLVRNYAQSSGYSAAFDVAAARRGTVILAGAATSASQGSTAIALRLRRNGAPDRSFGRNGLVRRRAVANSNQFTQTEPFPGAHALQLAGGLVILGGYYDKLGGQMPAIWALRRNGKPALGFGQRGRTISTVAGGSAQLADLAFSRRAGIYGVGYVGNLFAPPTGFAVRYRRP
jgi:uncharacterized delta-60 repeat protein